jgi:hypothetical protein
MNLFLSPHMPTSMITWRSEVLALIREVRETLARDPNQIRVLYHAIGAPQKITPVVSAQIDDLTAGMSGRR